MKSTFSILLLLLSFSMTAQDEIAGVYPFTIDNKNWGVINANKKVIVEPKYKRVNFFNAHKEKNAFSIVTSHENIFGVIDRNGKELIPPSYKGIYPIESKQDQNARARKNGKMGIINVMTQEVILPFEYDEIGWFKGEEVAIAVVKKDGKAGAVTSDGKIIAPPIYEYVFYETEGARPEMVLIDENEEGKIIDANGVVLSSSVPVQFDVENEGEDYSGFRKYFIKKEKSGEKEVTVILLKHPAVKETVKEVYEGAEEIVYVDVYVDEESKKPAYNYIIARKDGKIGILGKDKSILTPFEFDEYRLENMKQIILEKGELKGFADKNGKLVYDAIFSRIQFINTPVLKDEYFFLQRPDGAFGFADVKGNIFLPD